MRTTLMDSGVAFSMMIAPASNNYTVSFHNFKSQNFKLRVSNPKSKYVACLSVLSQISNCQGLGHKNKHEVLKTDHISNVMIVIVVSSSSSSSSSSSRSSSSSSSNSNIIISCVSSSSSNSNSSSIIMIRIIIIISIIIIIIIIIIICITSIIIIIDIMIKAPLPLRLQGVEVVAEVPSSL